MCKASGQKGTFTLVWIMKRPYEQYFNNFYLSVLVQRTTHYYLLIYIADILTQRHRVYFAKNKFVLLLMFLKHVLWSCNRVGQKLLLKAAAKLPKYTKKVTFWTVTPYCWLKVTKWSRWQAVFSSFISIIHLRPDTLLFSISMKTVIILELTCPCKENMENRIQKKFFKYDSLTTSIRCNGWSV